MTPTGDVTPAKVTAESNKNDFSIKVEHHAANNDVGYIEALAEIVEEYGIDPKRAANMITEGLKEKIKLEALRKKRIKPDDADSLGQLF